MHRNSILLFRKYVIKYFKEGMKILEIGPNKIPSDYRKSIEIENLTWETIDLVERENLTYICDDENSFPIDNNYYDIILSGQVIEHIRKPWIWVKELARVCKKGGFVITINPISWPYHEAPIDCWRIYPEGMQALYEEAKLNVIFSIFESLEAVELRNHRTRNLVPGRSAPIELYYNSKSFIYQIVKLFFSHKSGSRKIIKRFLKNYTRRIIGWPINCSYDTVTVGLKM